MHFSNTALVNTLFFSLATSLPIPSPDALSRRETGTLVGFVEAQDSVSIEYLYATEKPCTQLKGATVAGFSPQFQCRFFTYVHLF